MIDAMFVNLLLSGLPGVRRNIRGVIFDFNARVDYVSVIHTANAFLSLDVAGNSLDGFGVVTFQSRYHNRTT